MASHIKYDKGSITVEEVAIEGGARHPLTEASSSSLSVRIHKGKSVVTVSNLLSSKELGYLVQASLEAAKHQKVKEEEEEEEENNSLSASDDNGPSSSSSDNPGRLCVRMPTISAAQRNDIPDAGSKYLHDPLPLELNQYVEECILQRTMNYIDQELPDVAQTLFGADTSLLTLFLEGQLEYSTREPAVNVYYPPKGHFGIHKDKKSLTILMPLTSPETNFTGGGTAFWGQSHPNEHRHAPSLVLAPAAGTALLFGGTVSHKGLHIESGNRVVFVASFSRIPRKKASTWLVSAR